MPGGARLGDKAKGIDKHGCQVCPHIVRGPAVQASRDVQTNNKPAVRKGDAGIHLLCCGSNTWHAAGGSSTVTINGMPAFRENDPSEHCGGSGRQIEASSDVIIGDARSAALKKSAQNHAPFVCNCNK